jgi:DNA-binding MarR family transcriptional regulator
MAVIEELGKANTQEMSESVLLTQSYINILLQDLEAEGRIEKTGEFRMRRVVWRLKCPD